MHPIVINGTIIDEIQHSTHSVRTNCPHEFLPSLRLKIYSKQGTMPKKFNNVKTYMMHKRGMFVIGINQWNGINERLKTLRWIMRDVPFVALIHNQTYRGVDIQKCTQDLINNNIKYHFVNAWTESSQFLNNYSPKPFSFGLQSSGYILMLQGPFQIYNKVPGYVYPAEYMKTTAVESSY